MREDKDSLLGKMRYVIFLYFSAKSLIVCIAYVYFPDLFGQSIFRFDDFSYYASGDLGLGPNIGYRWMLWLLGIDSITDPLVIFLAAVLNLSVDVGWLYLLRRHLGPKGILFLAMALGLQPYVATYTLKFSTILFAKIGVLYYCRELLHGGLGKAKQNYFSLGELFFWGVFTSLRNSNLFIAAPYMFLRLKNSLLIRVLLVSCFVLLFFILSIGYLPGLNPSGRPWSLQYVEELLGIENIILVLLVTLLARLLILFGGREKLYGDGLEEFLVWGIPGVELILYVLLSIAQLYGFYIAMKFLFHKYGAPSLSLLIPLVLALFSVAHQRYLIPFVPICLFGLALRIDKSRG